MTMRGVSGVGADAFDYIGSELELFQHAENWKAYFARQLAGYIRGDVAEIGAGIGGTTAILCAGSEASWSCFEPDREMSKEISKKITQGDLPSNVSSINSTLGEYRADETFDTIIYIDVLEHIEHDLEEVEIAFKRLKPGGNLVVLSPAHQFLFSEFDASIGHFRRYSKTSLRALRPQAAEEHAFFYLDCVGLLASIANKILLKQSLPTLSQVLFWDHAMVPVSKILDPLIMRSLGKTVIGVWRKPD
ncbi:class I SAM-dependent methyltransferase [Hyphomonas oceanitis]|uniref:Type 12 methyltransferase n=1 Tax=Hyphomonas oceanitis SCH89 TaxID=1280953 RepID=A0A059G2E4_9PROT|nr:class I SAM-dependent methyltransferase [Hyphomonas oceanitis]KDA00335.1 type 12 methyltransferase [Hyphomonas oceanitis SCH89]